MKSFEEISADEYRQWDRQHVWHAFTQMAEYTPLIIERGEGNLLIDIDGRRLIDGVSSLWCNVHGHRHPKVDAAIRAQLDKVAHVTNLGQSNPTNIALAKRLADLTPQALNHVFFSDSGATSVEVALKMAFQYWQQCERPQPAKTKYAALSLAYHGDTVGTVSVGGIARFHEIFGPLLFQVIRVPAPDLYRLPEDVTHENACEHYLAAARRVLENHHEELAALVVEPLVQGAAGMHLQPPGYLSGLRKLTREFDVLLIADEVATGFGRTGKMFACEHEDVGPDLMCLAKGLTGGYLLMSATLATTEIYNAFLGTHAESRTFFHGHTYGGNPLAAAAAMATLDVFEEEGTLDQLPPKIERFQKHLKRIADHPHVGDVRQRGLMIGIELMQDRETKQAYPWQQARGRRACEAATERGVWLRPLGDVVIIMPPLSITLEQIDQIGDAALAGIEVATAD